MLCNLMLGVRKTQITFQTYEKKFVGKVQRVTQQSKTLSMLPIPYCKMWKMKYDSRK